jgi:hypothetical protein
MLTVHNLLRDPNYQYSFDSFHHVAKSGRITQKQNKNSHESYRMTADDYRRINSQLSHTIAASDNSYNEQTALQNKYGQQFQFSISEDGTVIGKVGVSTDVPSQFLEKLQQEAESGKISKTDVYEEVSRLDFDFRGLDFREDGSFDAQKLSTRTDYIASRYSVLKNTISNSNLIAEEKQQAFDKLQNYMNRAIDTLADSYTQMLGKDMTRLGESGKTEKIRNSVVVDIQDKISKYNSILKSGADYTGIHDRKDAWLKTDNAYLAAKLRSYSTSHTTKTETPHAADNSLFTEKELVGLGAIVNDLTTFVGYSAWNAQMDEEALGINFGMLSIKASVYETNSHFGNDADSIVNNMVQKSMNDYMDAIDKDFGDAVKDGMAGGTNEYPPLDRDAIRYISDRMLHTYFKTNDALAAIEDGTKAGLMQHRKKMTSKRYAENIRYRYEGAFWENFFSISSSGRRQYRTLNTQDMIQLNWQSFDNQFHTNENKQAKSLKLNNNLFANDNSGIWNDSNTTRRILIGHIHQYA